jgi:hypothetical protein
MLYAAWFFYLREPVLSLCWHMGHGNKVSIQGHKMTLPLMWRVEKSEKWPGLVLNRALLLHPPYAGFMGGEHIYIQSPSSDSAGVLDDASALRWQTEKMAETRSRIETATLNPENLYAKSMTYHCFDMKQANIHAESIFCKAGGTDWLVFVGTENVGASAVQMQLREAREILESTE